jgi:hypothetical protein
MNLKIPKLRMVDRPVLWFDCGPLPKTDWDCPNQSWFAVGSDCG